MRARERAALATLARVARALNAAGVRWAVGSSLMLFLRGATARFADVDLVIDRRDAQRAHAALCGALACRDAEPQLASKARLFCSTSFHRYIDGEVEVETMAGLHIREGGGEYLYAFRGPADAVDVEGERVPLCALEDWYVLYQLMPGREARVREIEAFWQSVAPSARRLRALLHTNLAPRVRLRLRRWLLAQGRLDAVRRRRARGLSIYYTSDTHGYVFPTNYAAPGDMPMGLLKLAAAFERGGNALVIDGGDTIQGSPFTAYAAREDLRPHPCALALNMAGYRYVTLGNHDFNMGLDVLDGYLRALEATCVCCNIRDRAGRLPIRPWAVHTLKNGLRVGLVGACTPFVRKWEKPETVRELWIEDPMEAVPRALEQMRPHADVRVLIYHGGFECDLSTGELLSDTGENQACALCRALDFDVLLAGHQHMAVDGVDICGTRAVQPPASAARFARVDVEMRRGRVSRATSQLLPPAGEPLAEAERLLKPFEARVQAWLDVPVGHLDAPLPAGTPLENALNGCLVANFVNAVQLEASGADISACSLPNEFKGMDRDVTVRDVVSTYIYANTLKVLRVTGSVLRAYLERTAEYFTLRDGKPAVSDAFLRPKVEHYNYDYFSGMDYTLDLCRSAGERVVSMRRDGREIRPEDELSLCVNSYRASGTGGYGMLVGLEVERDIQSDVAELIVDYIERHASVHVDRHRYLTTILPT